MLKAALLDAWPLAAALAVTCFGLAALARAARRTKYEVRSTKMQSLRPSYFVLRTLHRDQRGSVQSLSFVLTMPLFIMLMLLAVQITQLMIGMIVVHYAAFAAARSAAVWVPARVETPLELANWLNLRQLSGEDASTAIQASSKIVQIQRSAALACVPVAPSRTLGLADFKDPVTQSMISTYFAFSNSGQSNTQIPQRLANKWAYALQSTRVDVSTFHRQFGTSQSAYRDEPPLWQLEQAPEGYYQPTEIGWRDEITVKVTHNFALLPGPGRLLARRANESQRVDTVSRSILQSKGVYYIPLSASATMVPEGEKSVRPVVHYPFYP